MRVLSEAWKNAGYAESRELGNSMESKNLGWAGCTAVGQDPLRVSGAWAFRGTRVSVAAPFENLEDGVSITEFVGLLPGITVQQARLMLEHAAKSTAALVA